MTTSTKEPTHERIPCLPCHDQTGEGQPLLAAVALAATLTLGPAVTHAAEIPNEYKAFATCVSARESHGNYRAVNRDESGRTSPSSARGRRQFLQADWGHGLPYMVADRLARFGMPRPQARAIRVHLQRTPIDTWAPAYQDIGFVAVITASPRGWRHWWLAGSRCNRLAVTR